MCIDGSTLSQCNHSNRVTTFGYTKLDKLYAHRALFCMKSLQLKVLREVLVVFRLDQQLVGIVYLNPIQV